MNKKFRITDCISGRIGRLNRVTSNIYRKYLSDTDVTESQMMILLTLLEFKSIEQINLANLLALEKSSLSRNLVRLQKMGFIVKTSDYHPTISLTKEGVTYSIELEKVWLNAMEQLSEKIGKDGFEALELLESRI